MLSDSMFLGGNCLQCVHLLYASDPHVLSALASFSPQLYCFSLRSQDACNSARSLFHVIVFLGCHYFHPPASFASRKGVSPRVTVAPGAFKFVCVHEKNSPPLTSPSWRAGPAYEEVALFGVYVATLTAGVGQRYRWRNKAIRTDRDKEK